MNYFNTFQQIRGYLTKQFSAPFVLFSKYRVFYLAASTPTHRHLRIEELHDGLLGTSWLAKSHPIGSIDLEINKEKSLVEIHYWMINDNRT